MKLTLIIKLHVSFLLAFAAANVDMVESGLGVAAGVNGGGPSQASWQT